MKGIIRNTNEGYVVEYQEPKTLEFNTLPLHPNYTKDTLDHNIPTLFDGKEVTFHVNHEYPESCQQDPFCMGDETCIQCMIQYATIK